MKPLLCLFFLMLLPWSVLARDLVIVTEEWPPYSYAENGEVKGVVTEIVRTAMQRAGLSYSLGVYPFARAYRMTRNHDNVLLYSIFRLPNREDLFQWVRVSGLAVEMSLFKPRHREDIEISSLDDAKAYTVGVTRDTSTHHFLLSRGFEEYGNLLPLDSEEQNINMTRPGVERTDFATGDKLSLARWLHKAGLPQDYLEEVLPLFRKDIYLAFGRTAPPELVERVRRAVDEMAGDGTVAAIVDAHYERLENTSP